MGDSFDEWAELAQSAMDASRSIVTALLDDDPETAVDVLRDLPPSLRFHTTLALGTMVATSMEALAEAYGHDSALAAWQHSILVTLAEPPEG